MKTVKCVSDDTGEDLNEHITITIERNGYMIEYPSGNFTNRLSLDLSVDTDFSILKKIRFVENQNGAIYHNLLDGDIDGVR